MEMDFNVPLSLIGSGGEVQLSSPRLLDCWSPQPLEGDDHEMTNVPGFDAPI
jgi:hypothetical protein